METLNEDRVKRWRAKGSAGYSTVDYNVVKQTPVGYPLYAPDIIDFVVDTKHVVAKTFREIKL